MYIKGDYFILNTKNIIVRVQDVELRFIAPTGSDYRPAAEIYAVKRYKTPEEARAVFESIAEALKNGVDFFELPEPGRPIEWRK